MEKIVNSLLPQGMNESQPCQILASFLMMCVHVGEGVVLGLQSRTLYELGKCPTNIPILLL